MTFGEILARVEYKLWGNSTPDAGSVAVLTGSEGIIANVHQNIQHDYNYWFMRTTTTMDTVVGTSAYAMPTDLKEPVRFLFKVTGENYFRAPLLPLGTIQDIETMWSQVNSIAEYPTHYSFVDDNVVLYPEPSEIRTLHLSYWKIFDRPTAAFVDTTSSETDDVTVQCADAIVNLSCAEMCDIREEFQKAQIYRGLAQTSLAMVKKKDSNRRQKFLHEGLDYNGI